MGLNGHRGRAGVCPCAGWHRVGQWAARGIKGSLGGYAAGRRTLPALDLVYYQEAQYSRLLPVTASRYVTLPVILNGGYFRYCMAHAVGEAVRLVPLSATRLSIQPAALCRR